MKHLKRQLSLLVGCIFLGSPLWAQEVTTKSSTQDPEAWYIHFKTGKSLLETDYNGNEATLLHFKERVRAIQERNEYTIEKIRITGYASPDGPLELNKRLSQKRAEALKSYLSTYAQIPESQIEVSAGGENWNELRIMVETSNMKNKERVLEIISNTSEGVDPEIALRRLPDNTYSYMLSTFYPKLRSASSVQILRQVPIAVVPAVKEEVKESSFVKDTVSNVPQKEVVAEPKPCHCNPPFLAIKTNLAYWAAVITPNIELEAFFAKRLSVSVEGVYRWPKDRKAKGNNANVAYISPEFRYYLRNDATYQGHYFGLYGQYGEYDVKFGSTGHQGNARGMGLSYGYIFKFNRFDCLYFDLGISAGYNRLKYDNYYWYDPCNAFEGSKSKNYWGPTKLKASIMWRF